MRASSLFPLVRFFLLSAAISGAALCGCTNSSDDKKPEPASSLSSSEPSDFKLEATTVLIEENGKKYSRLTSFVDDFEITLPFDFRGVVLTDAEINKFASRITSDVPNLASQIRAQCNALRTAGGAVFAMNMRPSSVVDGFADNMNLSIRILPATQKADEFVAKSKKELESQVKGSKVVEAKLECGMGPMTELRFDSTEANGTVKVTRLLYITVKDGTAYSITYATATQKAAAFIPLARASAKSLTKL